MLSFNHSGEMLIRREGVGLTFEHGFDRTPAETLGYSLEIARFNSRHDLMGVSVDYSDPVNPLYTTVLIANHSATIISPATTDRNAVFVPQRMNSLGQTVGVLSVNRSPQLPYIWSDGVLSSLPVPSNVCYGAPLTILDSGDIYGEVATNDGLTFPVMWREGGISRLPIPEGYVSAGLISVNERGDYILWAERADHTANTFLFTDGVYYDRSVLPPSPAGDPLDGFGDLNDNGEILTSAGAEGGQSQIYLLRPIPESEVAKWLLPLFLFSQRRARAKHCMNGDLYKK
jgi:hypothetical protein